MKQLSYLIGLLIEITTAMVGYTTHHSFLWAVIDFLFAPLPWIKWLILHQVNISIIKATFAFLLK